MDVMWIGNRAIQAMGWAGMVKIASRWFSRKTYGTVMAIISLQIVEAHAFEQGIPPRVFVIAGFYAGA